MATGSTRLMAAFARRLAAPPTGSDADLLDRFATYRDEAAFVAILQRHGAAVLGVCRSRLGNAVDAEDAFQATFLVLARDAERIRNRESLAGWLYRVAQLVALKARRQNARRDTETLADDPPGTTCEPSETVAQRELKAIIAEELAAMPDKFRSVLVLCSLEERTNAEAAEILGCPRGTVDSRLATAKQKLKDRLLKRGVALGTLVGLEQLLPECANAGVRAADLFLKTAESVLKFTTGHAELSPALLIAHGVQTTMTNLTKLVATSLIAAGLLGTAGMGYYHATAEDQAKPTVKAEPKPKVAEKLDAPKPYKVETPLAADESNVRNALGKRMPIQSVRNLTVESVFAQLTQELKLEFRFDLAAFKRLSRMSQDEDGVNSGLPPDVKLFELKMPAHISTSGTLGEFLSDLVTIFPGHCSYRIRGNQIVIGPAYQPVSIPNRTADPTFVENLASTITAKLLVEQMMGEPVSIVIDKKPLPDAIKAIRQLTGANIILDARSLRGNMPDLIVSGTFDDVRLYTVLELLADMCDLKPVVLNNVYYITNPANAEKLQKKVNRELFGEQQPPSIAVPYGFVTDGINLYPNPGNLKLAPANSLPITVESMMGLGGGIPRRNATPIPAPQPAPAPEALKAPEKK